MTLGMEMKQVNLQRSRERVENLMRIKDIHNQKQIIFDRNSHQRQRDGRIQDLKSSSNGPKIEIDQQVLQSDPSLVNIGTIQEPCSKVPKLFNLENSFLRTENAFFSARATQTRNQQLSRSKLHQTEREMMRRRRVANRMFSPNTQSIKSNQNKPKIANLSLNQARIGYLNE